MSRHVQHITNRFGEPIDDNTDMDTPVMEALLSTMAEELCFIGKFDRQLGVILEVEFDDGVEMPWETNKAWHAFPTPPGVIKATPQAGSTTFGIYNNRAALWEFVPAEIATYDIMKALADRAFELVP